MPDVWAKVVLPDNRKIALKGPWGSRKEFLAALGNHERVGYFGDVLVHHPGLGEEVVLDDCVFDSYTLTQFRLMPGVDEPAVDEGHLALEGAPQATQWTNFEGPPPRPPASRYPSPTPSMTPPRPYPDDPSSDRRRWGPPTTSSTVVFRRPTFSNPTQIPHTKQPSSIDVVTSTERKRTHNGSPASDVAPLVLQSSSIHSAARQMKEEEQRHEDVEAATPLPTIRSATQYRSRPPGRGTRDITPPRPRNKNEVRAPPPRSFPVQPDDVPRGREESGDRRLRDQSPWWAELDPHDDAEESRREDPGPARKKQRLASPARIRPPPEKGRWATLFPEIHKAAEDKQGGKAVSLCEEALKDPEMRPYALTHLALLLVDGDAEDVVGVPRDLDRAVECLKEAVRLVHPDAMYHLADLYRSGLGVPEDMKQFFRLNEAARALGHAAATRDLALHYRAGVGVPQDDVKALALFREAVKGGDLEAQADLGIIMLRGDLGVEIDVEEGIRLLQESAAGNTVEAFVGLGDAHWIGTGVECSLKEACRQYEKAVEFGGIDHDMAGAALLGLGKCYYALNERRKAFTCFQKAVTVDFEESADAMKCLGSCYSDGAGVKKNLQLALSWLEKAAKLGHREACWCLACVKVVKRHPREDIFGWYKEAADLGYQPAHFNVGQRLVRGKGVRRDPKSGVLHLWKAGEHAEAQACLGSVYASGLPGVPKNTVQAIACYEKAVELGLARCRRHLKRLRGAQQRSAAS